MKILFLAAPATAAGVSPENPRCEYHHHRLAISTKTPQFSRKSPPQMPTLAIYEDRSAKVKAAFRGNDLQADSKLAIDNQIAYAMALFFDLIQADQRAAASGRHRRAPIAMIRILLLTALTAIGVSAAPIPLSLTRARGPDPSFQEKAGTVEIHGPIDAIDAKPDASATSQALESYLANQFPTQVSRVSVGQDKVRIQGGVGAETGPFLLADIPMDIVLNDPRSWETLVPIQPGKDGKFNIDVPRRRDRHGLSYDRLTSRWQIVRKAAPCCEPLSHARYASWVHCRSPKLPAAHPKNKKGLGGWNLARLPNELNELDDLGISAVTVNMMVQSLVSLTPGQGTVPAEWQGHTYYIRENAIRGFDASFREAAKHNIMVSAILLIGNPAKTSDPIVKTLGHPDAVKDGVFAMPNVTSEEGIGMYGAILNFVSERWSRPDGKYGRVHHWIIHNEVDAGWVWTNAGDKPAIVYMDLYQRSMRLTWLIAAQYDPHARPFISLTHYWATPGSAHWYGSKLILDLLVKFCQAEGDFPWALAYHPYPQDLRNPRAWEDGHATFSFNSEEITPKNLEVLDATMKRPEMLYHGKVRPVHLSENGFNSPDYSEKSLADQAAGMALAWKKIQTLSSIQSWQYHNWIDNRDEGGLRIGLRKFPDEPGDPLGKKPIWFLYQALGTPSENRIAAPYLQTIGIKSWDEIIHKEPIR